MSAPAALTRERAVSVRKEYADDRPLWWLAEKYEVSAATIRHCVCGIGAYEGFRNIIRTRGSTKLSPAKIDEIRRTYADDETLVIDATARLCGVSLTAAYHAIRGERYNLPDIRRIKRNMKGARG